MASNYSRVVKCVGRVRNCNNNNHSILFLRSSSTLLSHPFMGATSPLVVGGALSTMSTVSSPPKMPSSTSSSWMRKTTTMNSCYPSRSEFTGHFISSRSFSDKAADEKTTTTSSEEAEEKKKTAATEGAAEEESKEPEEKVEVETDAARIEKLEGELKQMKDSLLRSLAEQENTRRIAQRDVESARNFAIKSFAKNLLEVSDNLSRALEAVPEEMRKDKEGNPVLATLYEGIEMTEIGLNKAFGSGGLKKYGEVGDTFDPNKHEALFEYPDPEKEGGTIGQVMKTGFMLNDRVLRPAEVGVVKKES